MNDSSPSGPSMLVMTSSLRAPKVRIGHIGGNITLPRTVPLEALIAGGVGAVVGLIASFSLLGGSVQSVMYCVGLGIALGVFVVTWSPLKGESFAKWIGLTVGSRTKKITMNGEPVTLAVGVAVLSEVHSGVISMRAGSVNIAPSQYDERGVRYDARTIFDRLLSENGAQESAWLRMGEEGRDIELLDQDFAHRWREPQAFLSEHRNKRGTSRVSVARRRLARHVPLSPTLSDALGDVAASAFSAPGRNGGEERFTDVLTADVWHRVEARSSEPRQEVEVRASDTRGQYPGAGGVSVSDDRNMGDGEVTTSRIDAPSTSPSPFGAWQRP